MNTQHITHSPCPTQPQLLRSWLRPATVRSGGGAGARCRLVRRTAAGRPGRGRTGGRGGSMLGSMATAARDTARTAQTRARRHSRARVGRAGAESQLVCSNRVLRGKQTPDRRALVHLVPTTHLQTRLGQTPPPGMSNSHTSGHCRPSRAPDTDQTAAHHATHERHARQRHAALPDSVCRCARPPQSASGHREGISILTGTRVSHPPSPHPPRRARALMPRCSLPG